MTLIFGLCVDGEFDLVCSSAGYKCVGTVGGVELGLTLVLQLLCLARPQRLERHGIVRPGAVRVTRLLSPKELEICGEAC